MESSFAMLKRLAPFALLLVLPACGGHKSTATVVSTTPQTPPATTGGAAAAPPGALKAGAKSAAAGGIPGNQGFLEFADAQAGDTMKDPQGWAQQGGAGDV